MAISTVLMSADLGLTNSCLQANRCQEVNPLYGSRPSTARLFGTGLSIRALTAVITYKMKQGKHPKWWLPNAVMSAAHGAAVINAAAQR